MPKIILRSVPMLLLSVGLSTVAHDRGSVWSIVTALVAATAAVVMLVASQVHLNDAA